MVDPSIESSTPGPPPDVSARPGPRRWLVLAVLAAIAVAALAIWSASGNRSGPVDTRAATAVLRAEDLAGGLPASEVRRCLPPVDVGAVERGLRAATMGQVPMPASREVASYTLTDTQEQVTEAVLVYDDLEAASSLDRLAAPLLGSAFGLKAEDLSLPGTSDARRWHGHGYQVATFRVGGVVTLVATDSGDPDRLMELVMLARGKAVAAEAERAAAVPTAA